MFYFADSALSTLLLLIPNSNTVFFHSRKNKTVGPEVEFRSLVELSTFIFISLKLLLLKSPFLTTSLSESLIGSFLLTLFLLISS